jgi:hypothetical protein
VPRSRIFVFILLVVLTTIATARRPEGGVLREFLSADCGSPRGCQTVIAFWSGPSGHPGN